MGTARFPPPIHASQNRVRSPSSPLHASSTRMMHLKKEKEGKREKVVESRIRRNTSVLDTIDRSIKLWKIISPRKIFFFSLERSGGKNFKFQICCHLTIFFKIPILNLFFYKDFLKIPILNLFFL